MQLKFSSLLLFQSGLVAYVVVIVDVYSLLQSY